MEKKLAVIVDNNEEITTGEFATEMCSCGTDVAMEMCSQEYDDTRGDGLLAVQERPLNNCLRQLSSSQKCPCKHFWFLKSKGFSDFEQI